MRKQFFRLAIGLLTFVIGISITNLFGLFADRKPATPSQSNKIDIEYGTFFVLRTSFSEKRLSDPGRDAYNTLLVAKQFEDKAIGYAGSPSKLVDAYNVLLKEPGANDAFKSLLASATIAGQLYALCGLYLTDSSFFNSSIERFRYSQGSVETQSGCLGGRSAVSDLIEAANPIVIDSRHPTDSLYHYFELNTKMYADWNKRSKKQKKTDRPPSGYELDILHGGYSVWFAN